MAAPRILAGSAKGRALETPPRGTRPTPARLRAALFDALQGREDGRFLDLYAGSGAVGLEAASRGFDATLVERDAKASGVARRNARRLGLDARVVRGDALRFVEERPAGYDVVYVDPPYDLDLAAIFAAVVAARPVAPGGRYLLQHPSTLDPRPSVEAALAQAGIVPTSVATRRYGSNRLLVIDLP
jgi:16S rRNA (guanine(966)-N(2))-methyltransferase RsmD